MRFPEAGSSQLTLDSPAGAAAPARAAAARPALLALAALGLALLPLPVRAQAGWSASVSGQVLAADGGEPIRFSLIGLFPLDSTVRARAVLTDSAGRFSFAPVAPGEYRLRLDRIGYEPEPLPPFRVRVGDALGLVLRSDPQPVRLAAIVVPSQSCLSEEDLVLEPRLATLWREARKAGNARRLFDESYRYRVESHERLEDRRGLLGAAGASAKTQTLISTPALARELAARGPEYGYGGPTDGGLRLVGPELPELLGPSFARTHCLGLLPDRKKEHRILFRPRSDEGGLIDLAGTIVLDAAFRVKRIEFEYRQGGEAFAEGTIDYGDARVPGGNIRFARRLRVETPMWNGGRRTAMDHTFADAPGFRLGAQRATASLKPYDFVRDTTTRD